MIFIRLLISALLLTPGSFSKTTTQEENYSLYVAQIVYSIAKEAQQEFDLLYIGRGGELASGVSLIEVEFVAYRKGTLEEARKIQVILTERLLQALNGHEKLRSFLAEYPFPPSRISFGLSYRQSDDDHYKDGSVTFAFQAKNHIHYLSQPGTERQKTFLKKPYEEAKNRVLKGLKLL